MMIIEVTSATMCYSRRWQTKDLLYHLPKSAKVAEVDWPCAAAAVCAAQLRLCSSCLMRIATAEQSQPEQRSMIVLGTC